MRTSHTHTGTFTGGDTWTENRVALGVGWYYHHNHGYYGESSWNYTYQLIGLRKDGVLYGDTVVTSIDDHLTNPPQTYVLDQNYPNPFNPTTTIKFQIPHSSLVTLKVFDLLGGEVATLVNEEMGPGTYERVFNAEGLASGVYLYQLNAGSFVQTRKLLILR